MPKTIELKQRLEDQKSVTVPNITCTILSPFTIMVPTLSPTPPPQVLRRLVSSLIPIKPCLHTFPRFVHAIFPTRNIPSLLYLSKSHPLLENQYKSYLLYEVSPIHASPYSSLLFSEFLEHLLDCIIIYSVSSVYALFPMRF